MSARLSIGRFSKICGLSVKALRHYDQLGLLRPALVDPSTGYRYYEDGQAELAERIQILRSLDMPLEDVGALLARGRPEEERAVLEEHLARLRGEQRVLEGRIRGIEQLVAVGADGDVHVVTVKHLPAQWLVGVRRSVRREDSGRTVAGGVLEVSRLVAEQGWQRRGPAMTLHHSEAAGGEEGELEELELGIPVDRELEVPAPFHCRMLEAIWVAATLHVGPYEGLPAAHRALVRWASAAGETLGGPQRELYLRTPGHVVDPREYQTELQWPLELPHPPATGL